MIRYRKELNSSFFILRIHLNFVDMVNIGQKLILRTFAKRFYANFALQHNEIHLSALLFAFICAADLGDSHEELQLGHIFYYAFRCAAAHCKSSYIVRLPVQV